MAILDLQERKRRLIIPALGLVLAAYFLLVFKPLERKADSLDKPLTDAWKKLATTVGDSNALTLDFDAIAAKLGQTRQSLDVLDAARTRAAARVEPGPELRERISAPFQLVDFQNEVQQEISDLTKLAEQRKVTLAPAVAENFPECTAEVTQPELLWVELAFANDLLTLAINCQVSSIQSLNLPLALTNSPPANPAGRLVEIPVQLEVVGPMPGLSKLLGSLPLLGREIRAQGGPAVSTNKPALFIDRFLLRKESVDKPDEAHLWLRAVGFVFRE
jgi:hypothetical protein